MIQKKAIFEQPTNRWFFSNKLQMEHRRQSALAHCSPLNFSIDLLVVLIVDSDRGHIAPFSSYPFDLNEMVSRP